MTLKTGVMMLKIQLCHHRNTLYFTILKIKKQSKVLYIFIIVMFYFIVLFDQINAGLVSVRDFNNIHPKLLNSGIRRI